MPSETLCSLRYDPTSLFCRQRHGGPEMGSDLSITVEAKVMSFSELLKLRRD